ncbi:isopeptide-forming domain-containing fimbrial protein [Fusicatenibacter sp.]
MKTMKKVLAMLVSMVMVLAFCVTGVAANVELTQHTFAAYQIFKGDLTEGNKLSNVTWGDGVQGKELLAKLKKQAAFATCESAADVAKVLETYNTKSTEANAFAKTVAAYVTETKTDGTGKVNLPAAGYYLIVDTTATTGTYDAKNLSLLKVNGAGTVTPTKKTDKPTLEKKVKDINDSTEAETDWQDSADYDIGDEIPYKLTATMGDLSNYDHYYLNFHDTMTHLTLLKETVEVKVGEKTLAKEQYTVAWDADKKTMDVAIMDVKAHGAKKGTEVTVTYKATLDADAALGSTGNPNTADLEYSNNPNNTGNGTTKPNDTGKTPKDKNIVFTYKVTVNKVKENTQPLKGAEFELSKKAKDGSWISKGKLTGTGDDQNVFEWKGLDDGDYKIVETTTPSGYNTIDPIEFTITAEHEDKADDPKLTSLSGGKLSTGDVTTGAISATIVNKSGSTLPETGGIGTTVFYVIGGMLMAAAAVLLITKKRMNNK